jgi:hypothetical protein
MSMFDKYLQMSPCYCMIKCILGFQRRDHIIFPNMPLFSLDKNMNDFSQLVYCTFAQKYQWMQSKSDFKEILLNISLIVYIAVCLNST